MFTSMLLAHKHVIGLLHVHMLGCSGDLLGGPSMGSDGAWHGGYTGILSGLTEYPSADTQINMYVYISFLGPA